MKQRMFFGFVCAVLTGVLTVGFASATPLPSAPTDPNEPGAKVYQYDFEKLDSTCIGREVTVFMPKSTTTSEKFPVVAYGHGQALDVSHYEKTFEHLSRKGIAVAFLSYDTGFFDQDWMRMARDYNAQMDCVLKAFPKLDNKAVIYSGHSKGAYVASIAMGEVTGAGGSFQPGAAVLFQAAGHNAGALKKVSSALTLTVIFSDADTTVNRSDSDQIFNLASTSFKQFIFVRSYDSTSPTLKADHMWPLTKSTFFGGGDEGPLHYYGAWKWLVAAAQDLQSGGARTNPYLYGDRAGYKGLDSIRDEVQRSW